MAVFTPTIANTSCQINHGTMAMTIDGSTANHMAFQEVEGRTCYVGWWWTTPQDLTNFEMYVYGWADLNQTHIHSVYKVTAPYDPASPWSNLVLVHNTETSMPSDTWSSILRGNSPTGCYGIVIIIWINEDYWYDPEIKEVRATGTPYAEWHIESATVNFPATSVGQCTVLGQQYVTIHNQGTNTLIISATSNIGDFHPHSTPTIIYGGQMGNHEVQFCPDSAGTKNGIITFTCTHSPTGACVNPTIVTQAVTGVGTVSYVWHLTDPGGHNFGSQQVNTTSAAWPTAAHNDSAVSLNFTIAKGGSNPSNFTVSKTSCTAAANSNCDFTVTFTPTAVQSYSATITVTCTTANGSPASASFTVSGTGTAAPIYPKIQWWSGCTDCGYNPFDFGSLDVGLQSGTAGFVFENFQSGGSAASITLSLTGTNPGEFHIDGSTTRSVNPGALEDIMVYFQPTSVGVKTATLNINCSNCQSGYTSLTQNLRGTGTVTVYPQGDITEAHATPATFTHPGPTGASPTIYVTVKNTGTAAGNFIVHIEGYGETWDSDQFTLAVNASAQKSHVFPGTYGLSDGTPFKFLCQAECYRDASWWTDDSILVDVTVNYTWAIINNVTSYGYNGPFQQGATVLFCDLVMINAGNYQGTMYARYYYQDPSAGWMSPTGWLKTETITTGHETEKTCHHSLSIPAGIPLGLLNVGVLVWGQDEPEPTEIETGNPNQKRWQATFVEAADDWTITDPVLDYGEVPVGATVQNIHVVWNNQPVTITLTSSITDAVNFIVVPPSITVTYGQTGNFTTGFMPQTEGAFSATVTITCTKTGGCRPSTRTITLTGTGIPGVGCTAAFQETGFVEPGATIHADFTWQNAYNNYPGGGLGSMQIIRPDGTTICGNPFNIGVETGSHSLSCVTTDLGVYTALITVMNGYDVVQCQDTVEAKTGDFAVGDIDIPASTFYTSFTQGQQSALIADLKLLNVGAKDGTINTKYFYQITTPSPGWIALNSNPFPQAIPKNSSILVHHSLNIPANIPLGANTFGVKVWSTDETEPPTLILLGGMSIW